MRIAVVCPGSRLLPETAEQVRTLAAQHRPEAELVFHPQCFLASGHFAGTDVARADAFVEVANDPSIDAVWFGRGGYGSGRMTPLALPRLKSAAADKAYLGYSDMGVLLAALYGAGIGAPAHGPLVNDIVRDGGEAAVKRALDWLVVRGAETLEPSLADETRPTAAFNLAILSSIVGTPWQPELTGHVLMVEEVSEHMYRIDRYLMHVTSNLGVRAVAGLRLGRCSLIPPNDPDFALDEEAVAKSWCERSGIAWLGRADIGHDAANKVVPFGRS
jgi:muramoyltetrapeptide carboxypeptidase